MSLFEKFLEEKKGTPEYHIYRLWRFDKSYTYLGKPCRIYSIIENYDLNDIQLHICYINDDGIELRFISTKTNNINSRRISTYL